MIVDIYLRIFSDKVSFTARWPTVEVAAGREQGGEETTGFSQKKQLFLSVRLGWLRGTLMVILLGSGLKKRILNLENVSGVRKVSSLILEESMHFFDMPKETIINIWRMGVKAD